LYGPSLQGLRLGRDMIYRGTFGTGLFQTLYQPGPAHWAMLPSTLEWHFAAGLVALAGFFWWPAWIVAGVMLGLSLSVALLLATQATLPPQHEGFWGRLLIAGLCYAQPLVRSWSRYRTRLFSIACRDHLPQGSLARWRERPTGAKRQSERAIGLFIAIRRASLAPRLTHTNWAEVHIILGPCCRCTLPRKIMAGKASDPGPLPDAFDGAGQGWVSQMLRAVLGAHGLVAGRRALGGFCRAQARQAGARAIRAFDGLACSMGLLRQQDMPAATRESEV
jgi:hypothetical protein